MGKFFEGRSFLILLSIIAVGILGIQPFSAIGQQSPASSGANWVGPNGSYPFNTNHNPQNTITADNAKSLTVKWIWPVPLAPKTYNHRLEYDYNVQDIIV